MTDRFFLNAWQLSGAILAVVAMWCPIGLDIIFGVRSVRFLPAVAVCVWVAVCMSLYGVYLDRREELNQKRAVRDRENTEGMGI